MRYCHETFNSGWILLAHQYFCEVSDVFSTARLFGRT